MELTPRRREQIAKAVFDHFVLKTVIEDDHVFAGAVDLRFLNGLAKKLDCNAHALSVSISRACGRIASVATNGALPKEEEAKVMLAAAKYQISELEIPLKNYKREFGNFTAELNARNLGLNLKTKELLTFAFPIYWEIVEEIFEL